MLSSEDSSIAFLTVSSILSAVDSFGSSSGLDEVFEVIFDEVEDYALSTKFKKFVDLFVNEVIKNLKFKKDVVELICHTEVQNVLAKDCKELKCYFYTARFLFLHFYFFDVRCLLWSMLIKGLC